MKTTETTNTPQTANADFCAWLETTSFAGIMSPGDQWDTEEAWPSIETMTAARQCFAAWQAGDLAKAEALMHKAQQPFV